MLKKKKEISVTDMLSLAFSLTNPQLSLLLLFCPLILLLPTVYSLEHSEENTAWLLRGGRGHKGASCPGGGKQLAPFLTASLCPP